MTFTNLVSLVEEVSIGKEPYVGNPQVRFCEGYSIPHMKFEIKNYMEA